MQVPLQITVRDFDHSEALDARIREKLAKLGEFHPNIIGCRVTVEQLRKHLHQGREYHVIIVLRVPGHQVVATRDRDEDAYVALRYAFDAAKRELEDLAREQRHQVKAHELPLQGAIARLLPQEGIGFIETPDGREFYFSRENVVHPEFERLEPGMSVQFIEQLAAEGRQAKRISVGKHLG